MEEEILLNHTHGVKLNTNRVVNVEDARPHSWPWQVKHGSHFHHIEELTGASGD
ncbi:hypothetical protein PAMP_024777 [Pampus punctatissimus]